MRPDVLKHAASSTLYYVDVDFVLDINGDPVFPGDYVVYDRVGIGHGQRRRVTGIVDGKIKLHGVESRFDPHRFRRCGRYHPYHHNGVDKRHPIRKYLTNSEKKGNCMLHVAIRVPEGWNYHTLSTSINNMFLRDGSHTMLSDVTAVGLKERVKDRIKLHPDERWLILSGNTIAETSAPSVSFRQW